MIDQWLYSRHFRSWNLFVSASRSLPWLQLGELLVQRRERLHRALPVLRGWRQIHSVRDEKARYCERTKNKRNALCLHGHDWMSSISSCFPPLQSVPKAPTSWWCCWRWPVPFCSWGSSACSSGSCWSPSTTAGSLPSSRRSEPKPDGTRWGMIVLSAKSNSERAFRRLLYKSQTVPQRMVIVHGAVFNRIASSSASQGNNPLYKGATSTFKNVAYRGN